MGARPAEVFPGRVRERTRTGYNGRLERPERESLMSPMRAPERRLAPTPADSRFELVSEFQPRGDQPAALTELVAGIRRADRSQVLLGVTGSGKTFTMASVLAQVNRPALVLAHNKTLAAQLYQ